MSCICYNKIVKRDFTKPHGNFLGISRNRWFHTLTVTYMCHTITKATVFKPKLLLILFMFYNHYNVVHPVIIVGDFNAQIPRKIPISQLIIEVNVFLISLILHNFLLAINWCLMLS